MNENEIEKRIQTIEYQLHSFLMWMEVLGGSVAPFLTTEDLFDDALGKEFSHDIDLIPVQPPLQCKITLRLMAGKEYRQDPILKSVGPAPWFSLLEYRQVEDEVVTCLTFRKQSFTTDCHHVGLRQCLIRLNSVALLDQIIVIIPELMNAVETFFTTRIQEVFKGRIGTTFFLQNMNDIYNYVRLSYLLFSFCSPMIINIIYK